MIADEIITEIRNRADIVAVIGQYVQLKKAGRSWKGLCPFHGEKTASFNVMPDKGFFHCFGCQKNGDVFKFVMEMEGKSFVDVVEQLGARFGIEVPKVDESPELRKARGERVAMLDINKLATQFFREVLADAKRGELGRAYLDKRGVADAVSEKFQLGYAPADWHALADFLKDKRADLEIAAKLGLIRKQPKAGGYYDTFRDRLVCPVVVPGGEVVGFSARVIGSPPPGSDPPPKYINSPESTVYKKSKLLFGLAQAREGMQQTGRAVLVEGNFDVITLHQAGFHEVVAPLGTALTLEQVLQLKRLAERVVLVYDGDKAGYKATMHALQTCVEADVEVAVASRPGHAGSGGAGVLSGGVDPDSLVAGGGAAHLREAIDRAQGGIEYFCFEVWGKARANSDHRARALEHAGQLISKIENPIKRDLVIDTLAKALDVGVGVVRQAVQRAAGHAGRPQASGFRPQAEHPNAPQPPPGPEQSPKPASPPPIDEVELIALLLDHPSLIASPEADKAFWLLTDTRLRDIYTAARDGQSVPELVTVELPETTAKLVLSGKYAGVKDPIAQLGHMTIGFEDRKARLHKAELLKSMQEAQRRGDRELARRLAQEASEISSNRKQAE